MKLIHEIIYKNNVTKIKYMTTKKEEEENATENKSMEISRHFSMFLEKNNCAIVVTSYKRNVVLTISSTQNSKMSIYTSMFQRPMGVFYDKNSESLFLGTAAHVITFNRVKYDYDDGNYDTFLPTNMRLMSDIDSHDIVVLHDNENTKEHEPEILVASSLQNAIVSLNAPRGSLYKIHYCPDFMLQAEDGRKKRSTPPCTDCCHLNSLTLNKEENAVEYITCISTGTTVSSWRECRDDGGVIIKVSSENDKILTRDLSMPHSVRVCPDNGKLYVLDSGRGRFCEICPETGEKTTIAFIPGYLRGLAFIRDRYAIIGSSVDRHETCFRGLPLEKILKEKRVEAKCGIYIVSLKTGEIMHSATFPNLIEVYDVCVIPDTKMTRLCDLNDNNTLLTTHAIHV